MRIASLLVAIVISTLGATSAMGTDYTPRSVADRLLAEINVVRERNGLGLLRADRKLAMAAMDHAVDMAERDIFDHRAPDGAGLVSRIARVGYNYSHVAENIAAGHERPASVVETWLLSDGHRRNLLNPEDVDAGIGYVDAPDDGGRVSYRHYWVAIFGRRSR